MQGRKGIGVKPLSNRLQLLLKVCLINTTHIDVPHLTTWALLFTIPMNMTTALSQNSVR